MLKSVGFPSIRIGDQTIVDGNFVIGTAGKGIDFSIDPASAGATSELLDDYEEGSWTPAFLASTGTLGAITYENRQGSYVKVGNLVYITGGFYTSAFNAGTGSGILRITGLPFTPQSSPANVYPLAVGDNRLWTPNNPSGAEANGATNNILLYFRSTANGPSDYLTVASATNGAANNLIYFAGCYRTA